MVKLYTKRLIVFITVAVLSIITILSGVMLIINDGVLFTSKNSFILDVFHDQTDLFMSPLEPTSADDVAIRVRVKRGNISNANIIVTYNYDDSEITSSKKYVMEYDGKDTSGYYEYWKGIVPKQNISYKYHFELSNRKETVYTNIRKESIDKPFNNSNGDFLVIPNYKTPSWSKGATWYSIMPDSFYNGDITNDKYYAGVSSVNPWGIGHSGTYDYYGGDFKGIQEKLDYLKALGVNALQFNPLWVGTHQAGYGSYSLNQSDSCFGNIDAFTSLTNSLHNEMMKSVLVGVFQYLSPASSTLNYYDYFPTEGGVSKEDKYFEIAMRDGNGNIVYNEFGCPKIDYSKEEAREYVYTSPDSLMQVYLKSPYNIDGWFLDMGQALQGTTPGQWSDSEQIVADMRKALKTINKDTLIMSEFDFKNAYSKGIIDSMWNHNFYNDMCNWGQGIYNQTSLEEKLYQSVLSLPKSGANSSANFLTNLNMERYINLINGDEARMNAAQILLMTYVGAPMLFGDEQGIMSIPKPGVAKAAPSSFNSHEWNEEKINYDVYNLQLNLAKLRSKNSEIFKDGAYIKLLIDNKQELFGFGRFNSKGSVISVTNQSKKTVQNVKIEACKVGLKNGTKLTDYISGKQYKVKNGEVIIDVLPGGCVLAKDNDNSFIGSYAIDNKKGENFLENNNDIVVDGKGNLDDFSFVNKKGFNNVSLTAKIGDIRGKATIQIRDDITLGASFIGFEIAKKEAKIVARTKKGKDIESYDVFAVANGDYLRLLRCNDNVVKVQKSVDGKKYIDVLTTNLIVDMDYYVNVGVGALNKKAEFVNVSVKNENSQKNTNFENGKGSMFFVNGNEEDINVLNGNLIFSNSTSSNFVLSQAPALDFSAKTKLVGNPNNDTQRIGLVAFQESSQYVFFGKVKLQNSIKLVLASVVNNSLIIHQQLDYGEDTIYLQLEKNGVNYIGSYSVDGNNYTTFTSKCIANFSNIYCGLMSKNNGKSSFDFFEYGNSSVDSESVFANSFTGNIDYSIDDYAKYASYPSIKILGGTYVDIMEGIKQTKSDGNTGLNIKNVKYNDFKAELTLSLKDGSESGYCGLVFGNDNNLSFPTVNKGFAVILSATGNVTLSQEGQTLKEYKIIDFEKNKNYRIVVQVIDKRLTVLLGNNVNAIITFDINDYSGGFMDIVGCDTSYTILNWNFYHLNKNWGNIAGALNTSSKGKGLIIDSSSTGYAYASLNHSAYTNVILSFNLKLSKITSSRDGKFGILFGAPNGSHPEVGGLYLAVEAVGSNDKRLVIKEKNIEVASVNLPSTVNLKSTNFVIIIVNRTIYVYNGVDSSSEPILVYNDSVFRGGAFTYYAENSKTILEYLNIYALSNNITIDKVKEMGIFLNRQVDEAPPDNAIVNRAPLKDKTQIALTNISALSQFDRYAGEWDVLDGKLIGDGDSGKDWYAAAAFAGGTVNDFEIEYKLKIVSGAFAGINIRKSNYEAPYDKTGLFVFLTNDHNALYMLDGANNILLANDFKSSNDSNGFVNIKIKVVGTTIVTVVNGKNANVNPSYDFLESPRGNALEGYITFNSACSKSEFKDIVITPLKK